MSIQHKPKSHGEVQAANVRAAIDHDVPALPSARDAFHRRLVETWGDGQHKWQEGQCRVCGRDIGVDRIRVAVGDGQTVDVLVTNCSDCEPIVAQHYTPGNRDDDQPQSMTPRWDRDCPPRFRDAIIEDMPPPASCDAVASARVIQWRPSRGRGLVVTGPSGAGKTHALWHLARDLESDGHGPIVISSIDLFRELATSAKELAKAKWLLRCGVLMIDDLGKERLTPGACAVMHELIDERVNHYRPTIITTRYTGDAFVARFGEPEIGEDIRGRIAMASTHIHFREQKEAA